MDKNAIKKFAIWARKELIARVSLKGVEYGITDESSSQGAVVSDQLTVDSVNGRLLT